MNVTRRRFIEICGLPLIASTTSISLRNAPPEPVIYNPSEHAPQYNPSEGIAMENGLIKSEHCRHQSSLII